MKTRLWIAGMIYPMVNAVLFGALVIPMLSIPALSDQLTTLFPLVIAASFVLAAPVSWLLAPRLRARYWHARAVSRIR